MKGLYERSYNTLQIVNTLEPSQRQELNISDELWATIQTISKEYFAKENIAFGNLYQEMRDQVIRSEVRRS